jgi:hypothetical protein
LHASATLLSNGYISLCLFILRRCSPHSRFLQELKSLGYDIILGIHFIADEKEEKKSEQEDKTKSKDKKDEKKTKGIELFPTSRLPSIGMSSFVVRFCCSLSLCSALAFCFPTDKIPQKGQFASPGPGVLRFSFDNSFSTFRGKTILHKITVGQSVANGGLFLVASLYLSFSFFTLD